MLRPILAAALMLAAAPSFAAWQDMSASQFSVAPPPAAGSSAYQQDIAALLDWQDKRTPQQCSLAASMTVPDFQSLYAPSGILSQDEMARAQPLVDEVGKAVSKVTGVFKKQYRRPRPYNEDSRIAPCADKPAGATSYPSSHSSEGVVDACVLDLIFPDRAAKLDAWGRYVGQLRVIGGVHHPTDVAAGQQLGRDICSWLTTQPDFLSQVDALKAAAAR